MDIQVQKIKQALSDDEQNYDLLVNSSLKNFRVIISSIKKHSSQVEAFCNVSSSQLWVLWELHQSPGLKVSELASKLSIHQSTASNLIEKLVKRALINKQRDDFDQRVVRLYLTPAGTEVVLKAPNSPRGILRDALDHLPAENLSLLQKSLETLMAQIKLKDEKDALTPLADI
ncbi:MAG: MarR family transcriptional regulator [Methylotenera sp.]|nr:MarR family transcriptional regulator [Methylotenera sp.]